MAKTIDATFDPSSKWKPIEEGVYPAHVKSLETKEVSTRAGEAIVVNMRYKVADEVTEAINRKSKKAENLMLSGLDLIERFIMDLSNIKPKEIYADKRRED